MDQHLKTIDQKLDYLTEAAERQGRKDWYHTAIGVLITFGSALGLDQTQDKKLWSLFKETISGVIRLLS